MSGNGRPTRTARVITGIRQGPEGPVPFVFDPQHPEWEDDRAYPNRSAVRHDYSVWIAIAANEGVEPGTDPDTWTMFVDGQAALDAVIEAEAARDAAIGAAGTAASAAVAAVEAGLADVVTEAADYAEAAEAARDEALDAVQSVSASLDVIDIAAEALRRINLFDPAASTDSQTLNTIGAAVTNASMALSDFMPVIAGGQYTMSRAEGLAFYDDAREYVTGSYANPAQLYYTTTAPAGAAFMRVSTLKGLVPVAEMMVAAGESLPLRYTAFGQVITGAAAAPGTFSANALSTEAKAELFQPLDAVLYRPNIFDKDAAVDGVFINATTGREQANANYFASPLIEWPEGVTQVTLTRGNYVAQYRDGGVFIPGSTTNPASNAYVLTRHADARYFRFSSQKALATAAVFMAVPGNALPAAYVPFGGQLDGAAVKPKSITAAALADGVLGDSATDYRSGSYYLRETRQRLEKLIYGDAAKLTIACIGDSYTHSPARWTRPFLDRLCNFPNMLGAPLGNGGVGWTGFGAINNATLKNGNVRRATGGYYVEGSAGWTSLYAQTTSPDISSVSSADTSQWVMVASPTSAPITSAVRLLWNGTAAGVIDYEWGTYTSGDRALPASYSWGTAKTLPVQGAVGTLQSALLEDVPATAAWALRIKPSAGTVDLHGIDIQSAASGITLHKLGATGSRAQQWAAVNAAQWQAGMTLLAPNLVTILHGTNDQATRSPAQFAGDLQTIITRVRAALPLADIWIIQPPENLLGRSTTMASLTAEARSIARANKCAFLDLQHVFGDDPSEYGPSSARNWFNADNTHPDPTTGGRAIVSAMFRMAIYS